MHRVLGAAVPSLTAFTGLHSLYLYDNSVFGEPKLENYIRDTIENNSKTLTRLSLSGDVIWACPIRSLTNLHELEIIMPKELGGLALIFRHCVTLRSLTLHQDNIADEHPLFPVLESNLTALPELTAFKLIDHSAGETNVQRQILANFLENRKNLRKLDVCVGHDWDGERRDPCLDILPTLPALNVLALTFGECYGEDALLLDKLIPINVTALMLQVEVPFYEYEEDVLLRGWIDLVCVMMSRLTCTFTVILCFSSGNANPSNTFTSSTTPVMQISKSNSSRTIPSLCGWSDTVLISAGSSMIPKKEHQDTLLLGHLRG